MSQNYPQPFNGMARSASTTHSLQSSSLPSPLPTPIRTAERLFQPFASCSSSQLNRLPTETQGKVSQNIELVNNNSMNFSMPKVSNAFERFNSNALPFSPGLPYQQSDSPKLSPQKSIWSSSSEYQLSLNYQTPKYQVPSLRFPTPTIYRQNDPASSNMSRQTSLSLPMGGSVDPNRDEVYFIQAYTDTVNYKQLLNKRATCNWGMIICKILYLDEAPASTFLIQKLRSGLPSHQTGIIEAVIQYSLPLMLHYRGNFVLQRCLDVANVSQIQRMISVVPTNVVTLAICVSGSHVLQKLLDHTLIEDSFKSLLIDQMITAQPPYDLFNTLMDEKACRVWQRVMGMTWKTTTTSHNYIERIVAAMKGRWCEIGLHNMGSLIIQGIFEGGTPAQKQPLIDELMENIGDLARGQWGTWVVQHMVKQGDTATREATIQHILDDAVALSCNINGAYCVIRMLECDNLDEDSEGSETTESQTQRVVKSKQRRSDREIPTITTRFLQATIVPGVTQRTGLVDIATNGHGHVIIPLLYSKASTREKSIIRKVIIKHSVSLLRSKLGGQVIKFLNSQNHQNSNKLGEIHIKD
ncbi:ARM repeat-containing protein [Nadsonia fulvescens var. elongata DSM 6958]|uniref:ARM repeat-containing protein n=1 Tax=Nadsonia fulvescens var. elongata DSM 6958 TaxID=857566 RepID=A0A1E3PG58_9ASCO|nr:ARM repeat-containing protein [Nadsonia fulvescens var. elongata DSM 6958]